MITITTICPMCGKIGYSYDDRKNKGWLCPSCGFAGVKVDQVKESDDVQDLHEKEISIVEALEYNERKKTGEGIL